MMHTHIKTVYNIQNVCTFPYNNDQKLWRKKRRFRMHIAHMHSWRLPNFFNNKLCDAPMECVSFRVFLPHISKNMVHPKVYTIVIQTFEFAACVPQPNNRAFAIMIINFICRQQKKSSLSVQLHVPYSYARMRSTA